VGQASLELSKKTDSYTAVDIEKEVHKGSNSKKSYEEEIATTIQRALSDSLIKNDFYVVVLLRKERTMANVLRQQFFYRQTCPTPEFDQTVYKYHRGSSSLEYLWTVPDLMACTRLRHMKYHIADEQRLLYSMVEAFYNGDLQKLSDKLNMSIVIK
jgi:hypothetical protein